ncbi:MAG: MraY family glycosyltransferase [Tepidanaerobacteraceae bacterium]|jgi:UDP-GlcNAc:undecaprenyl-phosphate GlcNAc-1-phosphate transferase|nr:MraY family glycosyltransferase [Tepidanaerobacteraceae bacterium]HQE05562.1 MraY family glycosyltransferase [Tepidanaerobacteraceae bacterium]
MPRYIYGFLASMILAYLVTPSVMKLAWKIGAIDKPGDPRRIHKQPMPRLGGLAIYIAFVLTGLLTLPLKQGYIQGIFLGASLIVIVGIVDDIYNLPARVKLLGQIAAAGILVAFGVKVEIITNPLGGMFVLGKLAIPATLFWVVGITNTLNFIDGLDGLAAGIAAIAAFTMMLVNISLEQANGALVMAILAGAAIGFLPYNFNPAKIFMGDTGAMFLGFVLAAQAVEGTVKSATAIALIVPILALGLPIFDTAFAILRRFINGKPLMQADKGHVHHRLIAIGLSQKQAVLFMYIISISLGICSLVLARIGVKQAVIALSLVLFMLLVSVRYINIALDTKKSTHGM